MNSPLAPEDVVTQPALGADPSIPRSDPHDIADPDAGIFVLPSERRYDHRASLGEGGMGEVRLCRDLVIGRDVALKRVLEAHTGDGTIRARFTREARVQAQLEHPAIVPVYDFGTDAEGLPFFTMKRVHGVTLEQVLDALRRDDEPSKRLYTRHKLLGAFVQVCLAIDFAHERGVLHRDMKPANVMLGGHGEVYVLDWGLAKLRSASRSFDAASAPTAEPVVEPSAAATEVGVVLGTPGYMAPEQVKGEPLDARTDVYLLGGILFELLTLEPLNGGGSFAAIMKRCLQGVDARASVRAPGHDVPPELEELCVRACAVDPSKRPASARELADAVDSYLSGDRDLELRRTLAHTHLTRAREASNRALAPGGPTTARTEALQEVGRAMALDPADGRALELLVTMLTTPPREPPPAVVDAVETARRAAHRAALPGAAFIYVVAWLAFLPLQAHMGIVDSALIAMPLVAWTVAALALLVAHRFYNALQPYLTGLMVLSAIAIGLSSVVFGPLLLLPTVTVMSTMGTILITRRDWRRFLMVCNGLALIVPTALAWLGRHPVSHVVQGDRTLQIKLAAFNITHDGAFGILAASNFALFLFGAMFAVRYRDALTAAETKSQLHAWQLRQLVPADSTRGLDQSPASRR